MEQVIVLNHDYSFLNVVSVERAFGYIAKGKVVVEKYTKRFLTTFEKQFKVPLIVRFVYLIRQVYKRRVPWSKRNIWIRDGYICAYCGTKVSKNGATVDHVIPVSKGGKSTFENTVTACRACNNKKGDSLPGECGMYPSHRLVQPTITEFLKKWQAENGIDEIIRSLWNE